MTTPYHTELHCAMCKILFPRTNQNATLEPELYPAPAQRPSPSLPPGLGRLSISLTITPVIPPVDCQPCLRSQTQEHRVMSYWSWHCLTTASIPWLMSLVPSAHNPCYQLRPQPIDYQGLAGEYTIGPQNLPAISTQRENPMIFPCSVSIFGVGGPWFIISLRRDWLIGA